METYSLFQLNEYIKRVIALNFQDSIWINAEISQVKFSRGHYYIDLIQKEEGSDVIKAQASAIIWYRKVTFLEKKFKSVFNSIIDTGNEIRIKVSVSFSERYGFSLIVEDLDASFTLGKAELVKQQIIDRLKAEELIFLNAERPLPLVLQKIAVISSETAAGYQDFISHLHANSYGYAYNITLYQAAMQGQAVEKEVVSALDQIEEAEGNYDCIVLIRGGGAKLDLAAFDNYEIGKRIAMSTLPVITGIGHDIDSSVADLVSHTDLKTPTAVADFLIERNLSFESKILDIGLKLQMAFVSTMQTEIQRLELINEQIKYSFETIKNKELNKLNEIQIGLRHGAEVQLRSQKEMLDSMQKQATILAPSHILKRGFAILRKNGKAITSSKEVKEEDLLEAELADGKIKTKIVK